MRYTVRLAELQPQPAVAVHGHVAHDGVGEFINSAFGEVIKVITAHGGEITGAPFARYNVTEDGFDIEAGFPVDQALSPEGRCVPIALPGGQVAVTMHRGDYAEVAAAYEAAVGWVTENGLVVSGAPWECYLDDPTVAEPRTEVFVPCEAAQAHPS